MSRLQKVLYPLMIVSLAVLTFVFWGSIASIVFMLCAINSVIMYFWQRFMNRDRGNDLMDDENG